MANAQVGPVRRPTHRRAASSAHDGAPHRRGVTRRDAVVSLLGAAVAGCGGGGGSGSGGNTVPPTQAYGALRVEGASLVTRDDGRPVVLRGMNWGRWGTVQPEDAAAHVAQGANCVRIPLRWWGLYNPTSVDSRDDAASATAGIAPDHLALLDQMVQWASDAGLWIILFADSDCGQNGAQDAAEVAYCDPQGRYPGGHNFWSDLDARARFIAAWRFLADRYKSTPHLALFEPLPEPNPGAATDADITAFYAQVTDAIRAAAPGVPLLVGARAYWLNAVDGAYDAAWNDVVYTGDLFLQLGASQSATIQNLSDRLQHLLDLRSARNVPVFVQQVGVNSGDDPTQVYADAALSLLTTHGVGFAWWQYRDAADPNGYGVLYQAAGGWVTKTAVLSVIQRHFVAP